MIAKTKKNDEDELKKNVGKSLANAVLVFIPYGYIHSLIHKNPSEALPGEQGIYLYFRVTGEQMPNFEGNNGQILRGTGNI